jgi:hypothetical protein
MLHVLVLMDYHQVLTYMTETKANTRMEIYKFVISKILKQSLQFQPNKTHTYIRLEIK